MHIDWDALRLGQRGAIDAIRNRIRLGQRFTSIVLPTRYGKSDVMRVCAVALSDEGHVSCTLALSPNTTLRDQLADRDLWDAALRRYRIDVAPTIRTLDGMPVRPNANGEIFLSGTIQLAQINKKDTCDWIESEHNRTGLPVLVFLDEGHTGSEDNKWGKAAAAFADAGAHVVLLTATPDRSDHKRIPGFSFEEVKVEHVKRYKVTDSDRGPEYININVFEGQSTRLLLKADLEVKFSEAWGQDALCKLSRTPFDVDMRDDAGEHSAWLSELPPYKVRAQLGSIVTRSEVIEEGIKRMVDDLRRRKTFQQDAAAIIFCGNDNQGRAGEREANRHAKQILAEIGRQAPEMIFQIVTSAETDDGSGMLKKFRLGSYDGVIVKQMAGVGLDVGRVKTALDLSPTRTYAALVQRMMRAATPYAGVMVCTWISPDDVLGRAVFDRLVAEQGGEATAVDLELVDSYVKERKSSPGPEQLYAGATTAANFQDSDGERAAATHWGQVDALLMAFPELGRMIPHAAIASRLSGLRVLVAPNAPATVRDTRDDCARLRDDLGALRQRYMAGVPYADYPVRVREMWITAKRQAGWSDVSLELDDCSDVRMLEDLRSALDRMCSADTLW